MVKTGKLLLGIGAGLLGVAVVGSIVKPKEDESLIGGGGGGFSGFFTGLRESAGGVEKVVTVTEETVSENIAFPEETNISPKSSSGGSSRRASSFSRGTSGQSTEHGVAIRSDTTGKLVGIEDSPDAPNPQSRLPTPAEKIFNRPLPKQPSNPFSRFL